MTRRFHRATNWIVDVPILTVLLLVVISVVASMGYFAPDRVATFLNPPTEDASRDTNASPDENPPTPDVNPFNIGDADAIMVVESEEFFTPKGARTLRRVVAELESLPHVSSVVWLERVPILNIFGLQEPLLPRATASQQHFDNAKQKALKNPLVKGQFLSADANTLLLLLKFDFFFVESDADCVEGLRGVAERVAAAESDMQIQFSVTGNTPLRIAYWQQHEESLLKYQLIGYGMITLMAIVLFRGLSAVFIVAVAPALGVFWTLGLLPYLDVQDNPFNDVILPVLISLVGLTDGVHLMVHIRKLRASGLPTREAARSGVHEVGLACALTSLTTAVGFGSLMLASHEVVREFGMCCVIGVGCTFASVITTIPLLCASPIGRNVHKGLEHSLIDQNLAKLSGVVEFTLRHGRAFSVAGITTTIALAGICGFLRPDERRVEGMPQSAEPVVALAKMDRSMGGLEIAEIGIRWSRNVPSDSGQVLELITQVDDLLRTEELIGHPLSIRNLIDALPGDGEPADRMSMLELLPPPLKRAFYTPEHRYAKISFRIQDIGIAKYGPVFTRLEEAFTEINRRHADFHVELERSGAVRRWQDLHRIVVDLVESLFSASFIIFIVLTLVYRSLRIGLISIIPNLFPLVLAGSFLVVTGQYLEIVSVCAFTVCLGIAVDDTIHFLTRYHEERRVTDDEQQAITKAFTGVGTALVMTTAVLLAGFCTVLLSDNREHRIFASMGSITLGAALFADMIFLPAILARFARKSPQDQPNSDTKVEPTKTTSSI